MARRKTTESTHAAGQDRENNGTPDADSERIDVNETAEPRISEGFPPGFGLPGGLHHPMVNTIGAEGLAWHDQIITRAHLLAEQRGHITVYRT